MGLKTTGGGKEQISHMTTAGKCMEQNTKRTNVIGGSHPQEGGGGPYLVPKLQRYPARGTGSKEDGQRGKQTTGSNFPGRFH